MKHIIFFQFLWICILLFNISFKSYAQKKTITGTYQDSTLRTGARVNLLLSPMTLEEKVGQVCCLLGWEMYDKQGTKVNPSGQFKEIIKDRHIGMFWATLRADPWTRKTLETGLNPQLAAQATNVLQKYVMENTRLGIPLFFAEECPHGHMAIGTTIFPTSIGQSSTWNPELIQQMASTIALEARLQGAHIGYGPVLDLARDPRWSRMEETYGEDPVLNSRMGEAMVKGFQGRDLKSGINVISTLKHFTAYGVPEGGHNGGSISIGMRELHQSYLSPFRAAVKAGALSVMTAYNSIDGIPCSANAYLLKDLLLGEWNFKGFVVSDLASIEGLQSNHAVASSYEEAATLSLNAGVDVDLGGNAYKNLLNAVQTHKVSPALLDSATAHVLRLKFEMGLFENPYVDVAKAGKIVHNPEHIRLAREVARQSLILLKNDKQLLPLRKDLKHIAVIGANADNMYNQLGDYTPPQNPEHVVTVLKGIQNTAGKNTQISYVKGCGIRDTSSAEIQKAVDAAQQADVAIVVLGGSSARDFKTQYIETGAATVTPTTMSDMESGEGYDRSSLDMMGRQLELLQKIYETGTPVVLVLIEGRPLNINWASEHVPAILQAWYPGQEGGNAIADVLFGDINPAGRLPISIPRSVGQLPVYYNHNKPLKHDYVEMNAQPLYPFGYGLSYTTFKYENLITKVSSFSNAKQIEIRCMVTNTGNYDGDEVVQLYVRDDYSSVVTPVMQLKHFKRIKLKKGESQEVKFILTEDDLKLYNAQMQWVAEPGSFTVMVGASSQDIRLQSSFVW